MYLHEEFNSILQENDSDRMDVAIEGVLMAMFGRQEAFFKQNQAMMVKNLIMLLKHTKKKEVNYTDFIEVLLDEVLVKKYLEYLRNSLPENEPLESPKRILIKWYEEEFFGSNIDKVHDVLLGLRTQIQEYQKG